jgi:hypothetical protein
MSAKAASANDSTTGSNDATSGLLKAPRRPLSAYNFFFQDQRTKILGEQIMSQEEEHDTDARGNKKRKQRKTHGKIGFTALARHVGVAWKALAKEDRKDYEKRFKEDKVRYQKELAEYEEKLNSLMHLVQVKKALKTIRAQEAENEASKREAAAELKAHEEGQAQEQAKAHVNHIAAITMASSMQMQQQQLPQQQHHQMTAVHASSNPFTNYCSTAGSSFAALLQRAIFVNGNGNGNIQYAPAQQHHSSSQMGGRFKRRCSLDRTTLPAHHDQSGSQSCPDNTFPDHYGSSAVDPAPHSMIFSTGVSGEQQGGHNRAIRRFTAPSASSMFAQGRDMIDCSDKEEKEFNLDLFLPVPLSEVSLKDEGAIEKELRCSIHDSEEMKDIMISLARWDSEDVMPSLPLIDISAAFELDVEFPTKYASSKSNISSNCKSNGSPVKMEQVDSCSKTTFPHGDITDNDTLDFLQEFIYDDSSIV